MMSRVSSRLSVVWVRKQILAGSATSTCLGILLGLDQDGVAGGFAQGADLFVVLVADQHDGVALAGELDCLQMDLGHQRARGVDDIQIPAAWPRSEHWEKRRGR